MVNPHKWSPVSYRLSTGQGKFASSTAVPRNQKELPVVQSTVAKAPKGTPRTGGPDS